MLIRDIYTVDDLIKNLEDFSSSGYGKYHVALDGTKFDKLYLEVLDEELKTVEINGEYENYN